MGGKPVVATYAVVSVICIVHVRLSILGPHVSVWLSCVHGTGSLLAAAGFPRTSDNIIMMPSWAVANCLPFAAGIVQQQQ